MTVVNPDSIAGITSVTSSGTTLEFYDVNGNLLDVSANLTGQLTVGTGATINSPATNAIDFETNGAERLRIDSSGRVLIGTTTPGEASADDLTIGNGTNHTGITIRTGSSQWASIFFSDGTSGGAQYDGSIEYKHNDNYMRFKTGQNERLRIDSNGNIGVNCDSPTNLSNSRGITIQGASSTPAGFINFMDYADNSDGRILADNGVLTITADVSDNTASSAIAFNVDGTTERLRIDSNGHLSLRNAGNSHQELRWYSGSSLSASIGWGNGSANWEFKHFRGDAQAGAPYANIDFFTGSWTSPTRALRITEDGMLLLGETNDDGMSSYDIGMKNGRVIRHRNAAGNAWLNTFGLDSSNNIKIGWGGSPNEIHFGISGVGEALKILSDGNIRWWPDGSSGVNLHATSVTSGIVLAANKDGSVGTTWHFKNQNSSGQAQTWMEVDASQRVHIPYGMGGTDKLNIYVGADVTKGINIMGQDGNNQNSDSGRIHFNGYAQTNGPWIGGDNETAWGKKGLVFGTVSTANDYTTELGETMRLTRSGNIQFGISPNDTLWDSSNNEQGMYYRRSEGSFAMATRSSTGYSNWYMNKNTTGGTADTRWIDFYWDASTKDKIWYNSGNVAFGGYSDYRLKENITEIDDGIVKVKQLKPSYYNWKKGNGRDEFSDIKQDGFIAHELQSVMPNLVDGTKDQVVTQEQVDAGTQPEEGTVGTPIYQSIDYQRITPILTAALKEAIAKIEVLEAKVAVLESS